EVFPERRIAFDSHAGEPRNADLAFVGVGPAGRVAVTIEAKADEPFGDTVAATLSSALERAVARARGMSLRFEVTSVRFGTALSRRSNRHRELHVSGGRDCSER